MSARFQLRTWQGGCMACTWLLIGSVLIWHMYVPQSFIWTLETCSFQVLCPLCVTESLGLWATMCVWMARIAFESDLIHATCKTDNICHFQGTVMYDKRHVHHLHENGFWHVYYFRDNQGGTGHVCHRMDKTGKRTEYVNHIQKKTLDGPSISTKKDEQCVHVISSGK